MQLKDTPKSGYDLMASIKQVTGSWKPSAGSMYPLLKNLKKQGLLTQSIKGRKKIFSLTQKGHHYITNIAKQKNRLLQHISESVSVMEAVCGKEHVQMVREVINSIHEGKEPFAPLGREIAELRQTIFRIWRDGKMDSHTTKIKIIIKNTVRELKLV